MQISAANLLASQQSAQAQTAAKPAPIQANTPNFAAALNATPFAPLDFAAKTAERPQTAAQASPQPAPSRPGLHIDIKV